MRDDLFFTQFQFINFRVEVDLKLVNGTLKQNHLLTFFLRVDLHIFGNLVIMAHFKVKAAKRGTGFLELLLVSSSFTLVHMLFLKKFFNLLLAGFSFDLPLFSLALSIRLVLGSGLSGALFEGGLESGFGLINIFLVLFEIHSFLACELLLHHSLKLLNVFVKEFAHLRHTESGNV